MTLLAYGLNHRTAPLAIREKVAFGPERLAGSLRNLVDQVAVQEAAILSTCNRTELYCTAAAADDLLGWLAKQHQISANLLSPHTYAFQEHSAVRHIMRVASGLDSMVLGEAQILGQVKSAYAKACEVGTVGKELDHLFQHVFAVTKQVRTNTDIGVNPVSVVSVAINLAKHIFSDLATKQVLLIGAGETVELAARVFQQQGVKKFLVANRTLENANLLAQSFNGRGLAIGQISDHVHEADIILTATASPVPILGKGSIERALKMRRHRPMFILDLAVPRDVEPEVSSLDDIFLYNVEDLQHLVEQGLSGRRDAAKQAEQIIELELASYLSRQRAVGAIETICAYREKITDLGEAELAKALRELENGKAAEDVLRSMMQRLINKTMYDPTTQLRQAGLDGRDDLLQLARQLLGIEQIK